MTKTLRHTILTGLILTLIPGLQARDPETKPDLEISVRVYNYADVPRSVLERAQQETAHILRETGVESGWVACALKAEDLDNYPECNRRRGKADLVLVLAIVPREMAKRMAKQHDVFGVAASADSGKGYRANILHHRIKELAERWSASESLLLGHIIAHELGHLLLGTNSHSSYGIMYVPWTKQELQHAQTANLLFTSKQAKQIRKQVRNRIEAQFGLPLSPTAATSRQTSSRVKSGPQLNLLVKSHSNLA